MIHHWLGYKFHFRIPHLNIRDNFKRKIFIALFQILHAIERYKLFGLTHSSFSLCSINFQYLFNPRHVFQKKKKVYTQTYNLF